MDAECSQLLPQVCGILVDNRQLVSDDSCLEKLLDWFQSVISTVPAEQLLEANPCIVGLLQQVLSAEDADPNLISFAMRLVGIFATEKGGFQYLMDKGIVQNMFGAGCFSSEKWRDASVRSGWIQGLHSMIQHPQAVCFLSDSGAVDVILKLQMDSSLFVASAANQLVAHILLSSVDMGTENPKGANISSWPDCAQRILGHLEKSLASGISVSQSINALIAIYGTCKDALAEILWPHVAVMIDSLLNQKHISGEIHVEGLLLGVARFPVFSNPECDPWILINRGLKTLNPVQASSLALGILKLKHCPQDLGLQAASVLLYPLDCILRASSAQFGSSGLLDELVSDPAVVDDLISTKSSCIGLLCQCLTHIKELCPLDGLTVQIPRDCILSAVLTVLQFCIGQAVPASTSGSLFSRFLIGSLRVQRSAMDTIGAFSHWPMCPELLVKTYNVLLAYLQNPDTDPTVLKKTLQASVKWLQVSSHCGGGEHWTHSYRFLQDLIPVLMKRLCSPSWEVRDSTLEFLIHLTNVFAGHGDFRKLFSSSGVPRLVMDLLKDPESYVRASAVSCLGHIISIVHPCQTQSEGDNFISVPMKIQDIVPELINILSQDTEGFPRRAVVTVFSDWLKKGHIQNSSDSQHLLSSILEVTLGDLDWEVKMNALELAHVFVVQVLGLGVSHNCPYTVGLPLKEVHLSMTQTIQKCNQIGLFQFLLSALCDCDRPVALKSCDILLSVKAKIFEGEALSTELHGAEWLEFALRDWRLKENTECEGGLEYTNWVLDILKKLDLDRLKIDLSKSSDHIHKTPQSLLQDIMATAMAVEENEADCY
ncbi:integrator complex assembly factor BRAT1 [Discoglossus pictus]